MINLILSLLIFIIGAVVAPIHLNADDVFFHAKVQIKDHVFIPDTLEIPQNTRVKLEVENLDNTVEEFDSEDLKREKIIPGNSSATVSFGPLKKGEYHFIGEFHEETAKGKILVE